MDSLSALNALYKTTPEVNDRGVRSHRKTANDNGFGAVFDAALNLVGETNAAQVHADHEAINFALGRANNTHDLMIAEQKAAIALQFTVAVRDKFMTGYNQIMNMQV